MFGKLGEGEHGGSQRAWEDMAEGECGKGGRARVKRGLLCREKAFRLS